jgi:hypothetical protein
MNQLKTPRDILTQNAAGDIVPPRKFTSFPMVAWSRILFFAVAIRRIAQSGDPPGRPYRNAIAKEPLAVLSLPKDGDLDPFYYWSARLLRFTRNDIKNSFSTTPPVLILVLF